MTFNDNSLASKVLILVALAQELPRDKSYGWNVQYTGVGKINAAYNCLKNIYQFRPQMVLNFGSAGSLITGLTGLVTVNKVYQRDMDARPLGVELGHTPFESNKVINLNSGMLGERELGIKSVSCSTGDNFVSSTPDLKSDIVDMELYSIAKVCRYEEVPLVSFKYVSDNANENSPRDWKEQVREGSEIFQSKVLDALKNLKC